MRIHNKLYSFREFYEVIGSARPCLTRRGIKLRRRFVETKTVVIPANLVMSYNLRSSEMVYSRQKLTPEQDTMDGLNTMMTCREQEVKIM